MRPRTQLLLACAAVLLLADELRANAGTPLMWASAFHLLLGNCIIGLVEGLLIARLFAASQLRSVVLMILANYVSASLGACLLQSSLIASLPMDLENGWRWFWILVAAAYALTLLLEWPFVASCLVRTPGSLRRSCLASVVVQTTSYALLFGYYSYASDVSLFTRLAVVPAAQIALPDDVVVLYIAERDGAVHRRRLSSGAEEKVLDLGSTEKDDRLYFRSSTQGRDRWDLVAHVLNGEGGVANRVDVLPGVDGAVAPIEEEGDGTHGTWFKCGTAQRLGSASASPWGVWTGFWPIEGLVAQNQRSGERISIAHETPFAAWAARNAIHLPADKVVFQLGKDQICALDLVTRRIALLCRGRGPVAMVAAAASVEARTKAR